MSVLAVIRLQFATVLVAFGVVAAVFFLGVWAVRKAGAKRGRPVVSPLVADVAFWVGYVFVTAGVGLAVATIGRGCTFFDHR